jgi:hypothetical protein
MVLSPYHLKYNQRSDEELQKRADVKEQELKKIFEATKYKPAFEPVRVAVLGCADHRFVRHHKRIFQKLLQKPIELTTFDITVEHLRNKEGVVQHDCASPLPNPPYDITFGHVLLKFVETERQWLVIKNSYDALRSPGLAVHVFDEEDVTITSPRLPDGYFSVPLERWKKKLAEESIKFFELHWKIILEHMPIPIRGIKGGALVLMK